MAYVEALASAVVDASGRRNMRPARRPWHAARMCAIGCAITCVTLLSGAQSSPSAAARPARLNIVVILSDDERADSNVRMRHVQRLLGEHGVTFVNAFATTSECCPSRASILTGQYSHHTGVVQNFGPRSYPQFDEGSNLAVWLHDAGYETALVGKYLNDYTVYGKHHVPRGWSEWQAIDTRPEEKYYDYWVNENGKLVHYGTAASDYSTDVLADKAVRFVKNAREPFFLYFAPIAPHLPAIPAERDISTPLTLPRPRPDFDERDLSDKPWHALYRRVFGFAAVHYLDRDIEGRQLRALRELDRKVAELVRSLEERGLLDRTVIVYASDNGFLWGEHRLGGKIWPYEESIRVPLVVRVPWRNVWGTKDRHMVLNIDFASTIAALAGVRPRLKQDGRSIVPLLRGLSPKLAEGLPRRVPGREHVRGRRPAAVPSAPHETLAVRRVPERLARAVRPSPRPIRAQQYRPRARLRSRRGTARPPVAGALRSLESG
jgi:N-acetylglucosamine-6-sulfatase